MPAIIYIEEKSILDVTVKRFSEKYLRKTYLNKDLFSSKENWKQSSAHTKVGNLVIVTLTEEDNNTIYFIGSCNDFQDSKGNYIYYTDVSNKKPTVVSNESKVKDYMANSEKSKRKIATLIFDKRENPTLTYGVLDSLFNDTLFDKGEYSDNYSFANSSVTYTLENTVLLPTDGINLLTVDLVDINKEQLATFITRIPHLNKAGVYMSTVRTNTTGIV